MDMTGASALSISDFYCQSSVKGGAELDAASAAPYAKRRRGLPIFRANPVWTFASMDRVRIRWRQPPSVFVRSSTHYDIDKLRRRCSSRILGLDRPARNEAQERHIEFGPRWRNLKTVWLGRDEALSLLELPAEFASRSGHLSAASCIARYGDRQRDVPDQGQRGGRLSVCADFIRQRFDFRPAPG